MALVWVGLLLVVLLGFVALGIDIGRMHLARTELQIASDAAARAAVWPVPDLAFADSATRATAVIDANNAGGGAIGYVEADDLEFGTWIRNTNTFIPRTGADLVYANAVRVDTHRSSDRSNPLPMTFASIVGFTEADVQASSIAMIRGGWKYRGHGFGIVGLDWVQTNGVTRTDSYNPENGAYDPNNYNDGGSIGTNGYINLVGTTDINGDARFGPDPDTQETDYISTSNNTTVTGWQAPLDAELVYPPATAPATWDNSPLEAVATVDNQGVAETLDIIDDLRNVGMNGKKSVTIQGGTEANPAVFYVNDFSIDGNQTVQINGTVEIYATGDVTLLGNTTVAGQDGSNVQPFPKNLTVYVIGDGDVNIGGGSALYARVYAPESDVTIHGTSAEAGLFGSVIGKTLDILGNSAIHFDESTDWNLQPEMDEFWVELVR